MRTLLNLIWFFFGGLWLSIGYVLFGILACLLIITIPAGVASFRMAAFALWPFGKAVVPQPGAGAGSAVMNFLWFLIAGVWLALGHITTAFAQAITIIGIPLALANLKMIPVTCFPFGKQIVDIDALAVGVTPMYLAEPVAR
ncbi:MAG: YccF domain-containing protein [Actinomycetales bacterium]